MTTGLCVPVQAIIVPLYCNKGAPNVAFRRRDITLLTAHIWLYIHFIYLCVYYSSHHSLVHMLAILYRFCCTAWMIIYCYPDFTYSTYHWLKRRLPDCIRPSLRMILRDNYLSRKVWRNIRTVIYQRMGANYGDIDGNHFVVVVGLCSVWFKIIHHGVCDVIKLIVTNSKVLVLSMLLYHHTLGCYLAIVVFLVMITTSTFLTEHDQNHSTHIETIDSQTMNETTLTEIDHSQTVNEERFELPLPIKCTDNENINFLK